MSELQTRTIVKTDIRGFTARSAEISADALSRLLEDHRRLTTRITSEFGGSVFKEMGDSFLIAFPSATGAVQAAVEIQRELVAVQANLAHHEQIEIRAAIATGDVMGDGGDYFGEPVNLVARVEAITPAGEVYLAESTRQAVSRAEVTADYVGEYAFKGIAEPCRVYRAVYQHAVRILADATAVFTHVKTSTMTSLFAGQDPRVILPTVVDFWCDAHREVAIEHGGVLRPVYGDSYLVTFTDANAALRATLALDSIFTSRAGEHAATRPLSVTAGLDGGALAIYRTVVYGDAVGRCEKLCMLACRHTDRIIALLTSEVASALEPDLRSRCKKLGPSAPLLLEAKNRVELEELWMIEREGPAQRPASPP